jgi:hypothetical protein
MEVVAESLCLGPTNHGVIQYPSSAARDGSDGNASAGQGQD